MLKLIAFGEALVDMLSNRIEHREVDAHQPCSEHETFTKFPGGAPANVAAAVAQLGGNSYMAGKIGDDMFGHFMRDSLRNAKVKDDYLLETDLAKTALAFVSLDASGERRFSFYRDPSADMLFDATEFDDQWFDTAGVFHFCSNTLTADAIYDATVAGINKAKSAGFCISFDINIRHNLWPKNRDALPLIWQCIEQTDVLKLSVEEMEYLCRDSNQTQVINRIFTAGVSLILLTDGAQPLQYFVPHSATPTDSGINHYPANKILPPKVKMVDSTAAGDAFVGGFLYQLCQQNISREQLAAFCQNTEQLITALRFSCQCGGFAASREGAFTSLPTLLDIEQAMQ